MGLSGMSSRVHVFLGQELWVGPLWSEPTFFPSGFVVGTLQEELCVCLSFVTSLLWVKFPLKGSVNLLSCQVVIPLPKTKI